jgi:hypothetical protein
MEKFEKYTTVASKAFEKYYPNKDINSEENIHAIRLGASVMMTRDKFMPGGSFVQSVVSNDLEEAVNRADTTAFAHLPYLIYCKNYAHL